MNADQAKNASRQEGKRFCKVCFDAGQSEALCTSHYPKSSSGPDGKVICPTLLSQACLTCGKKGHTSSYCRAPSAVDNKAAKKWHNQKRKTLRAMSYTPPPREEEETQVQKVRGIAVKNSFELLQEEPAEDNKPQQTMAERLKSQALNAPCPNPSPNPSPNPTLAPPKLATFPPKTQFWWQDEDD